MNMGTRWNSSIYLIHIGKFQVFDVLISKGGDVIFLLELPAVYNQSVHLFIKYTDDNNSSLSYHRTTESASSTINQSNTWSTRLKYLTTDFELRLD